MFVLQKEERNKGVIKLEEGINNVKVAKYINPFSRISKQLAAIFLFLNCLLWYGTGKREEKLKLWGRIFFVSEKIQI